MSNDLIAAKPAELSKSELYDLFLRARPEAVSVSSVIEKANEYAEALEDLKVTSVEQLVPISNLLLVLGLVCYVVPGIVYYGVKTMQRSKKKKEIKEDIKQYEQKVSELKSEADRIAAGVKYLTRLPKDYRNALAINTMIGFLENDRASTWAELADKYEQQRHFWIVEKNTAEAAEYAALSALSSMQAADSAKSAAVLSGIGLVASILF